MTAPTRRLVGLPLVAVALVAMLAGTGRLITDGVAGVDEADRAAARWLVARREPWLLDVTAVATYLADTWVVVAATALLAAGTAWWSRRWWLPAGVIAMTAGETAIYEVASTLVQRPRPDVPRLDPGDPMAGFPSGHTAAAVCLYGGCALVLLGVLRHRDAERLPAPRRSWGRGPWGRWWRSWRSAVVLAAVAAPLTVAFCRTYRGMHHVSDVVAGLLLGACWLFTVNGVLLARAWPADSGGADSGGADSGGAGADQADVGKADVGKADVGKADAGREDRP